MLFGAQNKDCLQDMGGWWPFELVLGDSILTWLCS